MPTARSAAAPARISRSATPAPPHVVLDQRSSACPRRLDGRRDVADELCDVLRSDDDSVDACSLELVDLFPARDRHRRDRQLAGRDVGKQLECTCECIALVIPGREQEDLGVDALQRELELVLVPHLDDAVEPELHCLRVLAREPLVVLPGFRDGDGPCVGTGARGLGRRSLSPPEHGQLCHGPQVSDRRMDRERLGALFRGGTRSVQICHVHDHRDAVTLGDSVAEPARHRRKLKAALEAWCGFAVRAGRACAKQRAQLDARQYLIVLVSGELGALRRAQAPSRACREPASSLYWPTGCQTVLSSRKEAISHGLWASAAPRTTRFTLSAAACSRSGESPSAPDRKSTRLNSSHLGISYAVLC